MNKFNFLRQNCQWAVLFILYILILGCETKHDTQEVIISKTQSLSIDSEYDILVEHFPNNYVNINMNDENKTVDELQNSYQLGFHFAVNDIDDDLYNNYAYLMVLEPCENTIKYQDGYDYEIHNSTIGIELPLTVPEFDVYFKIEDLQNTGYISSDQKDLCLFNKEYLEGMGYTKDIMSNRLVYTAKEINAAMAEYEQLKAGE